MSDVEEKVAEKKHGKHLTAPVGLTVDVTPQLMMGNQVVCEIDAASGTSSKYVKGGVIKLPVAGQPYTITFQLVATNSPNLQFETNDPFWSSSNGCPTVPGNDPQFQPQIPCNQTTVVVDATPRPPKNGVYYRLNFLQNGAPLYCDPIIINN